MNLIDYRKHNISLLIYHTPGSDCSEKCDPGAAAGPLASITLSHLTVFFALCHYSMVYTCHVGLLSGDIHYYVIDNRRNCVQLLLQWLTHLRTTCHHAHLFVGKLKSCFVCQSVMHQSCGFISELKAVT